MRIVCGAVEVLTEMFDGVPAATAEAAPRLGSSRVRFARGSRGLSWAANSTRRIRPALTALAGDGGRPRCG